MKIIFSQSKKKIKRYMKLPMIIHMKHIIMKRKKKKFSHQHRKKRQKKWKMNNSYITKIMEKTMKIVNKTK
jgi:hypothetical protein